MDTYTAIRVIILVLLLALALYYQSATSSITSSTQLEKATPYECGFEVFYKPINYFIRYYITAILFLLFDLEVILLLPMVTAVGDITSASFILVYLVVVVIYIGVLIELNSSILL